MKDEEFIYEKLSFLTPKKVSVAATCMLDKIQHLSTEEQILGSASLFILICARYRLTQYGNILSQAHNYIFDSNEGLRTPFRGLERYMREILK